MKLTPGLKYLRGNDGFIYCFNEAKARRKDMTEFVAEGDEQQPVTEIEQKKVDRKEEVKKAKEAARARKGRAKKKAAKKAAPKVAKPKEIPVTAAGQRPDAS